MRRENNFKNTTIFLLIPLLLIGCGPSAAEPTASVEKPRIMTPSPTGTAASTPSSTLLPHEATQNAYFQAMQETQIYWMSTEVPSTLEARSAVCKGGFSRELYLEILSHSNDEWTLFTCSPVPENLDEELTPGVVDYGTRYTQIIKTDLSQTWTIKHQDYQGLTIDRPQALLRPYRWTQDGQYLYFYPTFYPGPSSVPTLALLRGLNRDLYRLNLSTGELERVLDTSQYNSFEISPNDQHLVYSENARPDVIHIIDLNTGDDRQVKLYQEILIAGRFTWNDESTKVVFAAGYGKESDDGRDDITAIAIYVLTVENTHARLIMAKDTRLLIPRECRYGGYGNRNNYWVDINIICLYPLTGELSLQRKEYALNIQTGALTERITPTPTLETTLTPTP